MVNRPATAQTSCQGAQNAIGDRYDLVLIAARRTRELNKGWKPLVDPGNHTSAVVALNEIEQGKIGREYLKKGTMLRRDEHPDDLDTEDK